MSRPSWNSSPPTTWEPHGDGPNEFVMNPWASGQTYPVRSAGAAGGSHVWARRRSTVTGVSNVRSSGTTRATGAAGAPAEPTATPAEVGPAARVVGVVEAGPSGAALADVAAEGVEE